MNTKIKKLFLMMFLCSVIFLIFPSSAHAAQKGWKKEGQFYKYRVHSSYVKDCVKKIKGKYYYFDKKGIRKSGWVDYKGHRYYFDKKTGAAYVGKHKIKKNNYIFRKTGRLVIKEGEFRQGKKIYYIGKKGKVLKGSQKIKKKWFYFDGEGNKKELPTETKVTSDIIKSNIIIGQLEKQTLDKYQLQNCNKLMIVAHPDDESLWGGGHLLDKGYFVVCLTNGNNTVRRSEFYAALKEYGCQGLMLSYPDLEGGKRSDWSKYTVKIVQDLELLLTYKKWDLIVTHNPKGEYGHIQHRMTSQLVTDVYRYAYKGMNRLFYFGKYYKWNELPKVQNSLIPLSESKLERKTQIINTVYKSQDVKWDRHMMKYENWISFQAWRE